MKRITFREYFESIQVLKNAVNAVPKKTSNYSLTKYCKLPILEADTNKNYISLKPKDVLEITWEYHNPDSPTPTSIKIISENQEKTTIYPAWSHAKFFKWVNNSTNELVETQK
jgi:hypothetical protein